MRLLSTPYTPLLVLLLAVVLPSHHVVNAIYPQGLLTLLKQHYPEWEPNAVVDIGANVGAWSHRVRVNYPDTRLLMLEATPKHEPALKEQVTKLGNAEYQITVLSGTTGDTVEFFQDGNTGNSMFRENSPHYQDSPAVTRTTMRLDDAVQQSFLGDLPAIDFIKADVQGAELLVLEGADKVLAGASFLQLESSTIEYNAGGACFHEVDAFLRSKGFYWYDISDMVRSPAFGSLGLGQFDVLYVNPSSPRLPAKFQELKGNYCGMNKEAPTVLSASASELLDKYGLLELEKVMEQNVVSQGKLQNVAGSSLLLVLGFFAGVWYANQKPDSKLRRRRR